VTTEWPAYVHGFSFSGKVEEVIATQPEQVMPALRKIEERVAGGLHAAGFLSYEAAGSINGDLTTSAAGELPLLWFGIYKERSSETSPPSDGTFSASDWQPSWSEERFSSAVAAIRDLIAAGDCYQVNLTMRLRFSFAGCPRSFFASMRRSQPTPYNCYLELDRYRVVSASPELFFSLAEGVLTTRPMKGTAGRGRSPEEDEALKTRLRESPKELAENLMIVDLLRNDMGIVSETGSVQVASLFDVETYPTVHQMTSTIQSRVGEGSSFTEVLRALYPCGSVTGAPKRRSMEIIAAIEQEPRGVYTGCIGYLSPGGEVRFSVAIRTALLDLETGRGEIGIGSGITFDSVAVDEYRECLDKGRFAQGNVAGFQLIESLLYDDGYFLLERHLDRLARSAAWFSFLFDREEARSALEINAPTASGSHKVRLLLSEDCSLHCEAAPIKEAAGAATAGFAARRVDSNNPFLYHKTTRRGLYADELAARPGLTEVIFVNERGEVTEGANSNIVAVVDGHFFTPPVPSGLLPGVFREELLATGKIAERVLTRLDLELADEIYAINSVRKWRQLRLV
jgi:para-aminobenzoate synthetase / 4-amino-4-deoxychorismate lyase